VGVIPPPPPPGFIFGRSPPHAVPAVFGPHVQRACPGATCRSGCGCFAGRRTLRHHPQPSPDSRSEVGGSVRRPRCGRRSDGPARAHPLRFLFRWRCIGIAAVAPSAVVPVPHLPLSLLLAQGGQLALLSWRDVGPSAELVADAVSVSSPLRKGVPLTGQVHRIQCTSHALPLTLDALLYQARPRATSVRWRARGRGTTAPSRGCRSCGSRRTPATSPP